MSYRQKDEFVIQGTGRGRLRITESSPDILLERNPQRDAMAIITFLEKRLTSGTFEAVVDYMIRKESKRRELFKDSIKKKLF